MDKSSTFADILKHWIEEEFPIMKGCVVVKETSSEEACRINLGVIGNKAGKEPDELLALAFSTKVTLYDPKGDGNMVTYSPLYDAADPQLFDKIKPKLKELIEKSETYTLRKIIATKKTEPQ